SSSSNSSNSPVKSTGSPFIQSLKPRDNLASMGSSTQLIIKDIGEIHSRLLDHRPVIQGETRYFIKEFEEKRGLREMRVLENLRNSISETNEHDLPKCTDVMQDQLASVLKKLETANHTIHRLQQRELETAKEIASRAGDQMMRAHWEPFMKEQEQRRRTVDEEHRKAVMRLKDQYVTMEKELSKQISF
uniref:Biogenesis of lysosome-related organelles complex 1 subunit 5 n=1 Tax=Xenopus tropicalis TaxID=8364 RepID=A0A6I8SXG4_XENTR